MLRSLLLALHEHAEKTEVASAIMEVLDHLGTQSPYKGGRRLLDLLTFARREAQLHESDDSLSGLDDALGYATGKVLVDDLKQRYAMYDGSGQDDIHMMERIMSGFSAAVAKEIESYLDDHPDSSTADIKAHFQERGGQALRFVRARRGGHYGAYRIRTEGYAWVTDVLSDRIDFISDLSSTGDDRRLRTLLAEPDAEALVAAAQLTIRREKLQDIRQLVANRYCTERQIQSAISGLPWIFGGQFLSVAPLRRLTAGLEIDIPLLRPDGVLHVVELKKANVQLIKPHRRSGHVLTSEVFDAIGQVVNYLRVLDEHRNELLEEHGIEARRAHGTVVAGHPLFSPDQDESFINEVLRTQASHWNRIDVITYKELLDNAERALNLDDVISQDPSTRTGPDKIRDSP